jgi:HEAT repeat protein
MRNYTLTLRRDWLFGVEGILVARSRRRFGVLFYLTTIVALVVLVSIPFWHIGIEQWTAWRHSRKLHDPVEAVRGEAAQGLMQLGPAASSWVIRAMRDPDARVRLLACSMLVRTAPDAAAAPLRALLAAVADSDVAVRVAAVGQIAAFSARYGSPSESGAREQAVRALCSALGDGSPQVRHASAWALYTIGPNAASAIGELDRALNGADKSLRVVAAEALMRIDPSTTRPRVIAALRLLLADQTVTFDHWRAVQILIRAQGEDATAALRVPLLKNKDLATRIQAMNDLIMHCAKAKALRPTLIGALASDDGFLRDEAALFFLKYEPDMAPRVIETLAEQIVDPLDGSHVLWDLIRKMQEVSPGLITSLVPALVARLNRTNRSTSRVNAIMALGEIGPAAASSVAALLEASKSGDLETAGRAVEALVKVDPRSATTKLSSLLDWMRPGQDSYVRLSAMASLRDLGPAATTAIPALVKIADEEDLTISTAAIEAISKIDPPTGTALKRAIATGTLRSRED